MRSLGRLSRAPLSHHRPLFRCYRTESTSKTGTLYVVATPIGNRGDLSARATRVLEGSPFVAAESIHLAQALLQDRQRDQQILSCHTHNEAERAPELLEVLQHGSDVALISKAGTPALCDPGSELIAAAHRAGFPVRPLPGPCSITAALSVSGLQATRFVFDGHLPALRSMRRSRLSRLAALAEDTEGHHGVIGPFNLVSFCDGAGLSDVLEDVESVVGSQTQICVAKDLSMPHERVLAGAAQEVRKRWIQLPVQAQRGGIVLLIGLPASQKTEGKAGTPAPPPPPGSVHNLGELQRVAQLLLKGGVSVQKAALLAAQLTGEPVAKAKEAVQQEALRSNDAERNVADAMPAEATDSSPGVAKQTLHLVNIGRHTSKEEVVAALHEVGAPSGDLSLAETHLGGKIAFVRFVSPEAAGRARSIINLAGLRLGGHKPVLAGWARRDRWLS